MSKLYELTAEISEVEAMLLTGELQPEDIGDTLDALNMEYKAKVENILKLRLSLLDDASCLEREIERLISLRDPIMGQVTSLENYVKGSMLSTDKDKLDLGLFKLTLRKPTKKLGAIDESKVPSDFWTEVPATKKLDKRALLKAAKESEIEGVELVDSERSLTIK